MDDAARARAIGASRLPVAAALTAAMVVLYFGFIALVAFNRPLMAHLVAPGLSLGILLGALVIIVSWLLTLGYVRWANAHDDALARGPQA